MSVENQQQKTIIINTSEARDLLHNYYFSFLKSHSKEDIVRLLLGGQTFPTVSKMPEREIIEKCITLKLGKELAVKNGEVSVDLVLIKVSNYTYECIWSKEDIEFEHLEE